MHVDFWDLLEEYGEAHYMDLEDWDPVESFEAIKLMTAEEIDDEKVYALFEGTVDGMNFCYRASIYLGDDGLKAECNCHDFERYGKCVHMAILMHDVMNDSIIAETSLPPKEKEQPEPLEEEEILGTAKEHPEMFARCVIAMDENLANDIAAAIRDRDYIYREMNYLACFIDSKARDKNIPDNFQLHHLFELASNFAAAVMAFEDIDYGRLIVEEVRLLTAADYYGGRCMKYGDPFNMDINRFWRLINSQLPRVLDDERFNVIVSSLYPLSEESAQYLLYGVKNMLTDFEIKALGVKLAEKGLKEAAKGLGWKKKSKKKK